MWDTTVRSSQRLNAFDQWCLRHIVRFPFTAHVTNQEVCLRSAQPPVTQTVMLRHLRFFGHIIRSDFDEDHTRPLNVGINDPPKEWKWPRGCPRQTWLSTIENDLKHQNLGLWSARHRAYDRDQWCDIVETATLRQGHATWSWWWFINYHSYGVALAIFNSQPFHRHLTTLGKLFTHRDVPPSTSTLIW